MFSRFWGVWGWWVSMREGLHRGLEGVDGQDPAIIQVQGRRSWGHLVNVASRRQSKRASRERSEERGGQGGEAPGLPKALGLPPPPDVPTPKASAQLICPYVKQFQRGTCRYPPMAVRRVTGRNWESQMGVGQVGCSQSLTLAPASPLVPLPTPDSHPYAPAGLAEPDPAHVPAHGAPTRRWRVWPERAPLHTAGPRRWPVSAAVATQRQEGGGPATGPEAPPLHPAPWLVLPHAGWPTKVASRTARPG